eukprot:CAMPEP_0169159314 /NCGR_PEP_ID=MMETSP1015-20121227/55726_1 /TAXON_ID=342587 /ORGANISM="Karlodinium micrum, Strain CCMP2283" /LENGTH=100 /DNA_ID=CAMNT_0009230657 /DNA_START=199 /DNA_END=498 /DNA_ORIENTATION=-
MADLVAEVASTRTHRGVTTSFLLFIAAFVIAFQKVMEVRHCHVLQRLILEPWLVLVGNTQIRKGVGPAGSRCAVWKVTAERRFPAMAKSCNSFRMRKTWQ